MKFSFFKTFFVAIFLVFFSSDSSAQSLEKYNGPDEVIFEKEWTVGMFLTTRGWGIDYTKIKIKDNTLKRFWQLSFQELRGKTEKRSPGGATPNGSLKGYYFGKENKVFTLDFLVGQQKKLTSHGRRKGVELAYNYRIGGTLGITKPYYMIMDVNELGGQVPVKYDGTNDDIFFFSYIFAGAGFGEGIDEIRFIPGGMAKASFIVDFATQQEFVKSLELGVQLQVFSKRVPIMVLEDDHFIHPNLFVKIMLGKRE